MHSLSAASSLRPMAVEHSRCDVASFETVTRARLEAAPRPIVIRGAASSWLANDRWRRDEIEARYGDEIFWAYRSGRNVTVRQALRACGRYYFGRNFWPRHGICYSDRYRQFTPFPLGAAAHDFSVAAALLPIFVLQMGLGCGRGIGVLPERHGAAWFTNVHGRKRWALYPPEVGLHAPSAVMPLASNCRVTLPSAETPTPLVCDVEEGDTMWVPAQWWHETCNLDEYTVGVGGLVYMHNGSASKGRGAPTDGWHVDGRPRCGDEQVGGRATEYDVDELPHCQAYGCSTLYEPRERGEGWTEHVGEQVGVQKSWQEPWHQLTKSDPPHGSWKGAKEEPDLVEQCQAV